MNLLESIAKLFAPSQELSTQLRDAIGTAGDLVGPMLRAASGYPERLAEPAAKALDYCGGLVRAIPGPVDVNRRAFASDPLVHALFGRSTDVGEMLGRSHVLREFLRDKSTGGNFYALLGTRRKEKRQFGMAVKGDRIISDVAQTTVYFSDHTLTDPANGIEEARERLRASMFRGLVQSYALAVRELVEERTRTERAFAMERARSGWRGTPVQEIPHAEQSRRLHELDAALRAHAKDLDSDRLMDQLAACFREPKPFLHLDPVEVTVDRMGVVVDSAEAGELANTLRFVELTSRDRRQWVVVLACIGYDEAIVAVRRMEQATRHIII